MRGNTLGGDHCQSWIMNLEPDYLRKLLVEISRAAVGNNIIMISSKSEKEGFSSRRGGFICGNWFNESTPFNWFLFTSTANIISIHWPDGIGLQRRTFEILGYSNYRNYAPPLDVKGGIITETVFPVFSECFFLLVLAWSCTFGS